MANRRLRIELGIITSAVAISMAAISTIGFADTTNVSHTPSPALPGLLPAPQEFPGVGRWQLMTKALRGFVPAIAWSPDGQRIAFGEMHHIRICDAVTLELIHVLVGHQGEVTSIAWSPDDGERLISSGIDGTIRQWTSDGVPLGLVSQRESPIYKVAYNVDGTLIATAEGDGTVRIVDLAGKEQAAFRGHKGAARSVTWEPDGEWLASGGDDHSVRLWKIDGTAGPVLEGHYGPVTSVDWSSDGTTIVSASRRSEDSNAEHTQAIVRMWDADGTPGLQLNDHNRDILFVAWDSLSHRFASVSEDRTVRVWLRNGEIENVLSMSSNAEQAVAWDPEGEFLAVGGRYSVQIVDASEKDSRRNPEQRTHLGGDGYLQFSELAWKPDGKKLATVTRKGKICVWNTDGTPEKTVTARDTASTALAWSWDGKWLATGSYGRKVQLWKEDGTPGPICEGHKGFIESLAWQPNGELLASTSSDSTVRLWKRDGSEAAVLEAEDEGIFAVAWSPDGEQLAAGDDEGLIQFWNKEGEELSERRTQDGTIDALAWSPDGKLLASGHNGPMKIWSTDDQQQQPAILLGHFESVMSIDWSPKGQQLVSGGWDKTVRTWQADGTANLVLHSHDAPVASVGWSPDGKWLASASYDRTLQIRNAASGELEWLAISLDDGDTATFGANGELIHGDKPAIEEQFVYLVEQKNGSMEVLSPSEFQQLVSSSGDSK